MIYTFFIYLPIYKSIFPRRHLVIISVFAVIHYCAKTDRSDEGDFPEAALGSRVEWLDDAWWVDVRHQVRILSSSFY